MKLFIDSGNIKGVMAGLDPEFHLKVKPGDLIVAGINFGMGSSAEDAPRSLRDAGIAVRRADTFPGLDPTWARIAVRPDARRNGLASRLLDELLVDTEDASRMLLEVSVSNSAALGFYVARQFSVIDVRPHYYRDGSEALVMCRWLPGAARTQTATAHD